MAVAVVITNESEASCVVGWGLELSLSEDLPLQIICPQKSSNDPSWKNVCPESQDPGDLAKSVFEYLANQHPDIGIQPSDPAPAGEATDEEDSEPARVSVWELAAASPLSELEGALRSRGIRWLFLPMFEATRANDKSDNQLEHLFHAAPCHVIGVRGQAPPEDKLEILLVGEGDMTNDDEFAIDLAARLAAKDRGRATLLYVRPSDDPVARQVAARHLRQMEQVIANQKIEVVPRVALADQFVEGIQQLELPDFDLLILGTRSSKTIRRVANQIKSVDEGGPRGLALARQSPPLSNRLFQTMANAIRSVVPQIAREQRVSLVDRLSSSSQFDFDFLALMSLSTLIAALGLARNSSAVVIGAMLVAPLMTPLVAMGLAIVQGNERLLRHATRSVLLGFTVALLIGVAIGLVLRLISGMPATPEMQARNAPNLLDLVVALASGVAGAYAMGRPHLISALPGVAIAAALVPPLATVGLSLSLGEGPLAAGAALLFFTNIVAIVLGTALTFWAVGIRTFVSEDESRKPRLWPRLWLAGLTVLSLLLAAEITIFNPIDREPNGTETVPAESSETAPAEGRP